ncbi:uncharacterized protein LOC132175221 [Corylus avellana]|uniref:uncharacterized protein LOC132175221 n=1 Tax=Corylus avellana TaxID=13451 RepID=UPI001E20DB35|nr:uncharacterized protein LOC132175221 [Corylus avellana]
MAVASSNTNIEFCVSETQTERNRAKRMVGTTEADNCSFVWDENSQLYFHASSGFYHDPVAGWYYSSRDGLYYKFEKGNYVLLESDKSDEGEVNQSKETGNDNPLQDDEAEASQCMENAPDGQTLGATDCSNGHSPDNPPPSEWLEDTLIELYLSGYSKPVVTAADDVMIPLETNDVDNFQLSAKGSSDTYEREGEWLLEDHYGVTNSGRSFPDDGVSWDEENWRAQYGQVIQSGEEPMPEFPIVDLWDWALVTGSRKDGKGDTVRLVGRLVRKSVKLHPSMPSGGGLLKTAPICEVHLDLVRVTSGQVYKLRTPNVGYLASLSTYDSSNPTKDWGFPELSVDRHSLPLSKSSGKHVSKTASGVTVSKDLSMLPDNLSASEKSRNHVYRDRAAERRTLHGGFGVGPGQKNSIVSENDLPSSPASSGREEAAAEALNMSFGADSYARKLLESMGWKEGEGLGNTTKGLVEPIQAVGNVGNAGLGWPRGIAKRHRDI